MHGTLNALGLVACVALTLVLLWRGRRMRPSRLRLFASILASLCLFIVSGMMALHLCDAGQPFTQMLIPSLCMAGVLMFVQHHWLRRLAALALIVAAFGLSQHFSILVHMNGYTGNARVGMRSRLSLLRSLRERINAVGPDDTTIYPAGWLFDNVAFDRSEFYEVEYLDHRANVSPAWHTWLTWIYRTDSVPTDVWFSGGALNDPGARVDIRDRLTG